MPWNKSFKAFFVCFVLGLISIEAQNTLTKEIEVEGIETISINGDQIFSISIETAQVNHVKVTSTLDGEYQNKYQVSTNLKGSELHLALEFMSFEDIPDDKRNAHKVIAATLHIAIPEKLNLNIISDIGSVDIIGNFNMLMIELLQGHCKINGSVKNATVNTIDGKIYVVTNSAKVSASSKNGKVLIEDIEVSGAALKLSSINGDITVVKQE